MLSHSDVLIVIPTYNENENVAHLLKDLYKHVPSAEFLIIDDHSPDGTSQSVVQLKDDIPRLHLITRPRKEGIGKAYREAFGWALERGYERIVQMDADFSHNPADVPRLLENMDPYDAVIGSRYVLNGKIDGWPMRRWLLSQTANYFVRHRLRLPIHDMTSGFRCWRSNVLKEIQVSSLKSDGYAFMVELTWRAVRSGFKIVEIPITFRERSRGTSKMGFKEIIEGFRQVSQYCKRSTQMSRSAPF